MVRLHYDLHIHTCLSPCGDDDMTPGDICSMASLKGLDMIAVTDHNTGLNLPAAAACAARSGLVFVPGIEITTREEVHLLGYFPDVKSAVEAGRIVTEHLPGAKNKPAFFGHQLVMDEEGSVKYELDSLLIGATDMTLNEAAAHVRSFGGVPVPAHINRGAHGILTNLGFIPEEAGFTAVEVARSLPCPAAAQAGRIVLHSSDAHYLGDIAEPEETIELEETTTAAFLRYLRGA